ncbi:MAG: 2-amino-4-hydroxy-6-hydroxymethyldihydropteridine diphosphokinase [Rhodocyclaceae bacterium]|nr:2-amino-4-hydroxy-6-hydroxymethyldihydropteridine diphosphokinase [Rhodocyclaceae bacterium]
MPVQVIAYVALGANLGDPVATVRAAFAALHGIAGTRFLTASALYRSAPVGLRNQPDFINAVAALEVDPAVLSAPTFLERLFAIEAAFGRVRSVKNAPRTLDLDLLMFGAEHLDLPGLTLPHPRMTERAFVLAPLGEIAPELHIPGCGRIADLLVGITGQRIERLS